DPEKAFVLRQAGYCQRAVGILRESAKWMEEALSVYAKEENHNECMQIYAVMSDLYLNLGNLDRALVCAKESVDRSDYLDYNFHRWVNRTRIGDVLHNLGKYNEAEKFFLEAEEIMRHTEQLNWYLYGFSGFRYLDLLLSMGAYQQVE